VVIDECLGMDYWNDINRGKKDVLRKEPVPFPLYSPQIPHEVA